MAVDYALLSLTAGLAGLVFTICRAERAPLVEAPLDDPRTPAGPADAADPEAMAWNPVVAAWVAFLALLVIVFLPVVTFGVAAPVLAFTLLARSDGLALWIRGMDATEVAGLKVGAVGGVLAGGAGLAHLGVAHLVGLTALPRELLDHAGVYGAGAVAGLLAVAALAHLGAARPVPAQGAPHRELRSA